MRPSVTWLNSRSSLAACDWLVTSSGHAHLDSRKFRQSASDVAEKWGRFLYRVYRPEEWLWIGSHGEMENRHPVERSFVNELPSVYNHCGIMAAWSRKALKKNHFFPFFKKKTTPCGKIFKILLRKDSSRQGSTCCVQIREIWLTEISKIAHTVRDRKWSQY